MDFKFHTTDRVATAIPMTPKAKAWLKEAYKVPEGRSVAMNKGMFMEFSRQVMERGMSLQATDTNSSIEVRENGGASFNGRDGVDTFRAAALASMLGGMAKGLRFRACTPTRALEMATAYTGVKYKRGEYQRAHDDVAAWVQSNKEAVAGVRHG